MIPNIFVWTMHLHTIGGWFFLIKEYQSFPTQLCVALIWAKPKENPNIPSGERLHNYGKSPFFNWKINYFYGHFQ
jgi:Tfp pilus assembly protein PilZ